MRSLGVWRAHDTAIKVYVVRAGEDVTEAQLDVARRRIEEAVDRASAFSPLGAGFAILHKGRDSLWLLVQVWIDGGICTRHLFSDTLNGTKLEEDERPFLACVWELVPLAYERDAWVRHDGPADLEAYLADRLPDGSY